MVAVCGHSAEGRHHFAALLLLIPRYWVIYSWQPKAILINVQVIRSGSTVPYSMFATVGDC